MPSIIDSLPRPLRSLRRRDDETREPLTARAATDHGLLTGLRPEFPCRYTRTILHGTDGAGRDWTFVTTACTHDRASWINVSGPLDRRTVVTLFQALWTNDQVTTLVLNLAEAELLDAAGIERLVTEVGRLARSGKTLYLAEAPVQVEVRHDTTGTPDSPPGTNELDRAAAGRPESRAARLSHEILYEVLLRRLPSSARGGGA